MAKRQVKNKQETSEPEKEAKKKKEATEWAVYDLNNKLIRVYSLEKHGEDAKELAEGFVKKATNSGAKIIANTEEKIDEPEEHRADYNSTMGDDGKPTFK